MERIDANPELGLTREEVRQRADAGWRNLPAESSGKTEKEIIRENCLTFFNFVFVALAVCLAVAGGSWKNMSFLVIAITNTVIGIFQEIRSKRAVDQLTLVAAQQLRTVRDGQLRPIRSDLLVRDDIVEFHAGDQICADAVVRTGQMQVNESLITGEADAILKKAGDELRSGSFVVAGTCRAQLTQVGSDSYAAQIAAEAKHNVHATKSEMMRSLDRLIRFVGILLIPVGVVLFWKQHWVLSVALDKSMESTVAALIGMIPEGLYLLTSVAMAASALKLARQKVLVQDMNCIETLARVDVLCVDKTGTITEPKMEVQDVVPLDAGSTTPERLEDILAALYSGQEPENDTGRAMCEMFSRDSRWRCTGRVPFSSEMKWSAAAFEGEGSFVVGAPEFILKERYEELRETVEPWSATGCRVLLIAAYGGKPETGRALDPAQVHPLALAVLTNRIRADAADTFRYFAREGVSVRVISGDNPVTVSDVARRAGIENAQAYVDASGLKTDGDFDRAVKEYTVFGRVTPENKRKLIRALKRAGHTVAMTGDGVNDVLALKEADCGIAMASGSQAASQVAQLVMLRSNFSAMPGVVGEGRRVINNIQRAAALFLVKNIFSLLLSLLSILLDVPYPLLPLHLSMISSVTIGIPSFFLALEPNYERVEGRFMPGVLRRAFPGGLTDLLVVLGMLAFFSEFALPQAQLYTVCAALVTAVGLLVLYQVCKPFNLQRKLIWSAMIAAAAFCFAVLNKVFEFHALDRRTAMVLTVFLLLTPTVFLTFQRSFDGVHAFLHKKKQALHEKRPPHQKKKKTA